MRAVNVFAGQAAFIEPGGLPRGYPRPRIPTVAELLAGKKLKYPAHRLETFTKAQRKTKHAQEELF